jgi:hypothetical protein
VMQKTGRAMVSPPRAEPVRRRNATEWAKLVSAWRSSGETADAFAARAGTRATTLAWWSSELSRRARASVPSLSAKSSTSSVTFLPVSVRSSIVMAASRTLARINVGGLTVEVEHGADAREVAGLCRALAELAEC